MSVYYKLAGHDPVPVDDPIEWARCFETADRRVALDEVCGKRVSTVFLGIDHGFGRARLLFETMVFPNSESLMEERCDRYATWNEAEAGHRRVVDELRAACP